MNNYKKIINKMKILSEQVIRGVLVDIGVDIWKTIGSLMIHWGQVISKLDIRPFSRSEEEVRINLIV